MRKNGLLVVLSLNAIIVMTSCGGGSKRPSITNKTSKDLYFYSYNLETKKFDKGSEYLKTYFFNESSIPYVSLNDYTSVFLKENAQKLAAKYTCSVNGGNAYITSNNPNFKATAIVNTDAQTLSYDTYSGYETNLINSLFPLCGIVYGGEYLFKDLKYECTASSTYTIDLTKYNLKAYCDNNEVYLPYHVCLNALGNNGSTYIYNGNGYHFIPQLQDPEDGYTAAKLIRESKANNAFNNEYQQYSYDHIVFTFDSFYGLDKRQTRTGDREEYVYFKDGAYKTLEKYKSKLLSTEPNVSNEAFFNLYNEYLNDGGHSVYQDINIFSTEMQMIDPTGDTLNNKECAEQLIAVRALANLNPEHIKPNHDFIGYVENRSDVLFVTIDSFAPKKDKYTRDDFNDEDYGKCAITVLGKANEEIQNNRNIKNVVLDLSCNLGGVGYMPLQILSWINKGNMNFTIKSNLDGTVIKGSGHADVNLDGTFDSKDYLPNDVNVYVICSPSSYSSGNYTCCLLSEVDGVKFIGERSGGGSCNINAISNALGSTMSISGNTQLCFNKEKDGKIVSVEKGVTPEYYPIPISYKYLDDASRFYDRNAIVKKILDQFI